MGIGESFADGAAPAPVSVFAAAAGGAVTLSEWDAKRALADFGVATPEGRLCDRGEVVDAAAAIGYPIVLKAVVPDLAHKTEAGAVVVGIADADGLRRAVDAMAFPEARFLVEAMVPAPVAELLVGVTRDPQFGLTLTVGAGGSLVELLADARTLLFPLTERAVGAALDTLAASRLLAGYRGGPKGDRAAAIAAIMQIADFAIAHGDRLEELDVNPLMVLPEGVGAVAADALIRIREDARDE